MESMQNLQEYSRVYEVSQVIWRTLHRNTGGVIVAP